MSMVCLGECLEAGPPPDSILFMPPPPLPAFLQPPDLLLNTTPCSSTRLCEAPALPAFPQHPNQVPDVGDYVELPRKDIESWSVSSIDDTWLLILVASSVGILLLGALLAMFLLKCREMNLFGSACSLHVRPTARPLKPPQYPTDPVAPAKIVPPPAPTLYRPPPPPAPDNRMVWAALTPRGTRHFVSETGYPTVEYAEPGEHHYETVDGYRGTQAPGGYGYLRGLTLRLGRDKEKSSCENSGFIDFDYEEPTPLISPSYRVGTFRGEPQYAPVLLGGNTDMRCTGTATLRRGLAMRPRVSSPTRIEHPNLPPLNLHPHSRAGTLRRGSLEQLGGCPKYGAGC